jgi:hypothetical protein
VTMRAGVWTLCRMENPSCGACGPFGREGLKIVWPKGSSADAAVGAS